MITLENFIANQNTYQHHAILLLSNYFYANSIPDNDFKLIAEKFCHISLYKSEESSAFESAIFHPDIFVADRERKVLRLEDIKKIRNFSLYHPQQGSRRLFVIENCERLNVNAANSLLKVLEEPSSQCLFLFTSSKSSVVLPTILSRVQKIALTFAEAKRENPKELFLPEDVQWMKCQIEKFSLTHSQTQTPKELSSILSHCEKLSKEYKLEDLKALFVTLLAEKTKQDHKFIPISKILLSNITQWTNFENYHPSTFLWLVRLFLLF